MKIPFTKMNGTGNDFIIIDGREGIMDGLDRPEFVRRVCRRRESVGADGVIIVENSNQGDFKWDFFNSDGSAAEMCGNGARCVARFAAGKKIAPRQMSFLTTSGLVNAEVKGSLVKVKLPEPSGFIKEGHLYSGRKKIKFGFINTGVPHTVLFTPHLENAEVLELGRKLRYHRRFAPQGTNVNFVSVDLGTVFVRTYERGVEGETLACGTGAVASAILATHRGFAEPPVRVVTRSGAILTVDFSLSGVGANNVYMEGDTALVSEGYIRDEAIK